jgi:hypothetical protein
MSQAELLKIKRDTASLKQFNDAARLELRAVRKRLRKVSASSEKKERHKGELLRRRRETVEKLRLANGEYERLHGEIAALRGELRNEKHANLVEACQLMVRQYMEEIERDVQQGVGVGAVAEKARNLRRLRLFDESDTRFEEEEERKLVLGRLSDISDTAQVADFDPHDRGAGRHGLEAHESGVAGVSGVVANEVALRLKDGQRRRKKNEKERKGNPQGTGEIHDGDGDEDDDGDDDGGNNDGGGGGGGVASKRHRGDDDDDDDDEEDGDEFTKEVDAVKRWVKSRQKQLMQIRNDDEDVMLEAKAERSALALTSSGGGGGGGASKSGTSGGQRGQFAVDVVYKEQQGFMYTCQLAVLRNYTFKDLVAEACAHWGLAPEYTFLEDPKTGAIWASSAVVEAELPLHTSTPSLNLVFREHMDIASLVMQDESKHFFGGGGGDDAHGMLGDVGYGGGGSKQFGGQGGEGARKTLSEDVHDVARFHPFHIKAENKRNVRARNKLRKAQIDPKLFKLRKSFLARDFLAFSAFFILLNLSVLGKRNIVNQFWLLQAFEMPLVNREFVGAQFDSVPKLDKAGNIPVDPAGKASSAANSNNHNDAYDSYRWWQQIAYRDIRDAQQWWLWVEGPLQDLLYGPSNGTNHTAGYLREGSTQLLGKLRFRQLRVKANRGCSVSYLAKEYYPNCYAEFSDERQDTAQFTTEKNTDGFSWSSGGGTSGQSTRISGAYATYPGDGYVVDVPFTTRDDFGYEIARLRANNWLDLQTRAVFIEFTAFNPAYGNYISNHYLIEQSASGLWTTSTNAYIGSMDVCVFCEPFYATLDAALYLVILWILYNEVLLLMHACRVRSGLRTYCCISFWSAHYCITVSCFLFSLFLRAATTAKTLSTLQGLWGASGSGGGGAKATYYDITESLRTTDLADFIDAFCILFLALRIFRYLQYNSRMQQFTRVFVLASMEIVFFAFMFGFTFFGFVLLGHNIYGAYLEEWSTIIGTFRTLVKMMVGNFDYEAMRQVDQVWTPVFFFVYIIFVFMILVNVFLAILNTSYSNVREARTLEKTRFEKMKAQRPHAAEKDKKAAALAVSAAAAQGPKAGSRNPYRGCVGRVQTRVYVFFGLSEGDPVFSRHAFVMKGIYEPIDKVKRELREKNAKQGESVNPWVAT